MRRRSPSTAAFTACAGLRGKLNSFAQMLTVPARMGASAVSLPARPFAASFSVPSPPHTKSSGSPRAAAAAASSLPCPPPRPSRLPPLPLPALGPQPALRLLQPLPRGDVVRRRVHDDERLPAAFAAHGEILCAAR